MIEFIKDMETGRVYEVDPHQKEIYKHLMSNSGAIIAAEMSLSKTVATATAVHDLIYREAAASKALIIAPNNVARITWPQELAKWEHLKGTRYSVLIGEPDKRLAALNTPAEIYIISVDCLQWLIDLYITKTARGYRGALPFDLILIDELTIFKNSSGVRFKALERAIKTVPIRFGLTGTIIPKGFIDLWAQLKLIDDGARLGKTKTEYINKYFTTRGNGMIVYEYRLNKGADVAIGRKISDIVLSITLEDTAVTVPDVALVDIVKEFTPGQKEVYEQLEEEYFLDIEGESVTVKAASDLINKLLQLSSGAIYVNEGKEWKELHDVKTSAVLELLARFPDENFIVVYQFRHEAERLAALIPYAKILGTGSQTARDFEDWNAGLIPVLILHPAAAGHGLNMQYGGRNIIWFSPTYNAEHWLQTIARLKRRNVKKLVRVFRILIKGTRDASVIKVVDKKQSVQNFLLTEIKQIRKKYGKVCK